MLTIVFIKYKPVYKVSLDGEQIGYVKNKSEIQKTIDEYIYNTDNNIAFVMDENLPKYELSFISNDIKTNEEQVLLSVKKKPIVTYISYAVVLDGENKAYVNSQEEAEQYVNEIKEKYNDDDFKLDLGIKQVYSNNTESVEAVELKVAKANLDKIVEEKEEVEESTVNGVYLKKPVSGVITSRYGSISRVRSGAHTGLDIAASTGTPIKACAEGTVTHADWQGSLGKLVIVEHDNGVETYYAHCSEIYVKVGDKVDTDTVLAAMGSTGNSTGPHLHLEIRVNGKTLNPQNYLYN